MIFKDQGYHVKDFAKQKIKYVKRLITPVAIRNNALLEVKYFAYNSEHVYTKSTQL